MNKLRVFQNVKNIKGTVSGSSKTGPGAVLLIFLFLPYIITLLFGNSNKEKELEIRQLLLEQLREGNYTVINETSIGRESIALEVYVADKLMRTMEEGYEAEALKAQAVLIRSNLISGDRSVTVSDEMYGKREIPEEYLVAVAQTKGIYPEYDGEPVYGAYFRVSNGRTRAAQEILSLEKYAYLTSVVCDRDFLSKDYAGTRVFEKREFDKIWEQLSDTGQEEREERKTGENDRYEEKGGIGLLRDSAGYVISLKYQDKWVLGEQFRYAFDLPSAAFQIEENENELIFTWKGTGHGFGMSQFGANEMALEGKNYMEILEYFFEGITFTKIE